ncbi:alpha-L-arabinofuranosidase C-terminal domain-containing protein [Sphingobacterium oryzagri]|uniref:non-reducing end alpha-L-arabinofuranosidase n=1 Tax=Sphingobacterium oryzagri TaxID=3025669 RepID=A0ABY7WGP0_9SPHI|nr:alpha-L-arabinofuranosidase C-terminal domain-containing protein [Sphingobacterium sp. KACC 22765]WDF67691.1 alpha-L-arabinofuranosidase C-terminal domain-containing protein [Sphingobacterium sp. KACC 22765]
MKNLLVFVLLSLFHGALFSQQNQITIDADQSLGNINPLVYGQFIEYIGRCIDGGIYEENNPLSDDRGFRKDVLAKAKALNPTTLRFPGGTVVKTFHWEDGVGPKELRKAKKNLIWGGVDSYQFGTCEFIEYCRALQAEPCLVVNLSTGTAEEAANWVEYCNGTGNTYYANLRRAHGYAEPFQVKFWALGNEEGAEPDAGRHQDPNDYVKDVWHFIKLMKLTDPSIKLIANGEAMNEHWNKTVLDGIGNAVDYLSYHYYVNTTANQPYSIFEKIATAEKEIEHLGNFIRKNYSDTVQNWSEWYRFPHREEPIKLSFDEWGIWEKQDPPYGTTNVYTWRHALATASFLQVIQRKAKTIGIANWAQMVNILAPIMSDEDGSVKQTIFYPLQAYRQYGLGESIVAESHSPTLPGGIVALDLSATIDREKKLLTLFAVNRSLQEIQAPLTLNNAKIKEVKSKISYSSSSLEAKNTLAAKEVDVVQVAEQKNIQQNKPLTFASESITIYTFTLQ